MEEGKRRERDDRGGGDRKVRERKRGRHRKEGERW